jgi:hypothetical protein
VAKLHAAYKLPDGDLVPLCRNRPSTKYVSRVTEDLTKVECRTCLFHLRQRAAHSERNGA